MGLLSWFDAAPEEHVRLDAMPIELLTQGSRPRLDNNWNGLVTNGPWDLHSGGGWMNFATGLGTFGRDKVMQGSFIDSLRITDPELAAMYHGNDLAARIVEKRPTEMFRRGYDVVIPDPDSDGQTENAELADKITKYGAKIRVNEIIRDGMIWGRLFGGCIGIIGADDGQDVSLPLNEDNIKSVRYLNLVDRRFLFAHTYYGDPFNPNFGEVETYQVTNAFGDQQQSMVHESRILRFDGAPVDILKRRMLAGWTLSVLQRPYDVLRAFDSSFQAAANLLVDASQGVFKIKNLISMISSGEWPTLQRRMGMVDMMRSSGRAIMVDADEEDFERKQTSFAGIPDTLDRFMQRLASAAEMPVTILFGREPAGLSATGEADFQHWYDTIANEQKNVLEPKLKRIYELICLAADGPCGGVMPKDGIEIYFHPLRQPSDAEQATLEKTIGDRDVAYVTAGILLPEEVAMSRFKGGDFSLSTEIDIDARKESMKHELDFMQQNAQNKSEMAELSPGEPANPQQAPIPTASSSANPQTGRQP
jgi:uncharacterized protein